MFSLFLGIFGTCLALMGMCQAGNLERSNLEPLSIVYTLYPYYNSETLLGIVKAEEPLRLSSNIVPIGRESEQAQEVRNSANAGTRDESAEESNNRDSSRNHSNDSSRQRNEQATEITYWPPVQRGAAPKPRLGRASGLQPVNQKKGV